MKTLDVLKVGLVLVALVIWGYGLRTGRHNLVIVGLVFVVIAFLLRWLPKITRRP